MHICICVHARICMYFVRAFLLSICAYTVCIHICIEDTYVYVNAYSSLSLLPASSLC